MGLHRSRVYPKVIWEKLTSAADEMVRELEPKWQQRMEQKIKQQHSARQRNHLFPKTILLSLGGGLFLQTKINYIQNIQNVLKLFQH